MRYKGPFDVILRGCKHNFFPGQNSDHVILKEPKRLKNPPKSSEAGDSSVGVVSLRMTNLGLHSQNMHYFVAEFLNSKLSR